MIKDTVAFCGLFCEACGVYIATAKNDQNELERIAKTMNTTKEEIPCKGCRSTALSPHCRDCKFRSCAKGKQLLNCEECDSFPCQDIKEFQTKMPHRAELFNSTEYRKKYGIEKWMKKMREDYSCNKCKTINSPYYIKCKNCGEKPGNPFISRNIDLFVKKD